MKTKIPVLVAMLLSFICVAQQGINYKAVIKEGSGNIVANDLIQLQFSILEGATSVYTETHSPTTDADGLIIVNIGEGAQVSGSFSAIDWSSDEHFLNVKVNTGGGLTDLGTTQFKAVPYAINAETATVAQNVSGLEAIVEGPNDYRGWRLKGRDPLNYGDIGLNAVDLSYSGSNSGTHGATGYLATAMGVNTTASDYYSTAMGGSTTASGSFSTAMGDSTTASGGSSTAMGENTIASGSSSTAMGSATTASGDYSTALGSDTESMGRGSTAMGSATTASGDYSTALGSDTESMGRSSTAMGSATTASGDYSTAMGYATTASGVVSIAMGLGAKAIGDQSVAMGIDTEASGENSTAMGYFTQAESFASLVVGRYNIGGGDPDDWVATDPLVELGNGTSSNNKSNALTILKNGNATLAGSLSQNSDRRLKNNIEDLNYGLDEVLNLKPVSYKWKRFPDQPKSLGLIAQEVQPIISEIVSVADDEAQTLGVSYTELIPVLINAIKQQQEIIKSQKGEIEANNEQYQALLSRVESLEANLTN